MQPRGFGLLGKNIDLGTFLAVAMVNDFFINKYKNNHQLLREIDSATIECAELLEMHGGKLRPAEAFNFSNALADKYHRYIS